MSLQPVEQYSTNTQTGRPRAEARRIRPFSFAAGSGVLAFLTAVTKANATGYWQLWLAEVSEVDTITKSGTVTSGTWTITVDGQVSGTIQFGDSNATILGILNAIAHAAPLIGLLGTVIGLLDSFTSLSSANGVATQADVARGVYQSLITSALGLVVAIPAYLSFAFLSARARSLMHDLERAGIEIVNLIEDANSTDNIVEFRQAEAAPPMTKSRGRGMKG